jgi:hypothetical protein
MPLVLTYPSLSQIHVTQESKSSRVLTSTENQNKIQENQKLKDEKK